MKKQVKKKVEINTNKIATSDNLKNNSGRKLPLTTLAGVTRKPRRFQFGGNYDR